MTRVYYFKVEHHRLMRGSAIAVGEGEKLPTPETILETHDLVYESEEPLGNTLDDIFSCFQAGMMSWEVCNQICLAQASHTSMSVGDVIETNEGLFYMVDCIGWHKL